jgi:chromate reductase
VLFVTPEYNRSLPGCLKNAIDVGSRSSDKSAWKGKAAGVVSAAPHNLGGFGANLAVRQSLVYLNMPVMQQPEAYISNAADLFGEDGSVKSEATQDFIRTFMSAYGQWVAKIAVSPAG